jgi:hypothetical protein
MPKGLQIYMYKKLFLKWNADRRDNTAEMDNIDWDAVIDPTMNFHENLHNLKNNYPEYSWSDWRAELDKQQQEQEAAVAELVERGKDQYQPDTETDSAKDVQPEDTDRWHMEQTEEWEIHSIEIEIQPHNTQSKGKLYNYGRVQVSVDPKWVGLVAKISVQVPKALLP